MNFKAIKKILLIKPRGIGDIVLSTIVIDDLKKTYPSAEIHYLTETFAKDALANNPFVAKVHTMEKTEFVLKVVFRLRKEKFDMIIDLWSNPRSAQITFLTHAKYRVGFSYRGRKYAYNILGTSEKGEHHSAEHNLELLKTLGIAINSKRIHFYVSEEESKWAKEFIKSNLSSNRKLIGIIPSGGWPSKRCDAAKWVEICTAIKQKYDAAFLILWGPGDEIDANYIKNILKEDAVLIPEVKIGKLSALIKYCNLVIANDSGPMHISAALGVPTLGIFGPTNPKAHKPYSPNSDYVIKEDLHCIICNKLECPFNHECMKELSVEEVLTKVEPLKLANPLSLTLE
ncbi:MAG: glycosyltransferase family 9 protein [Ignavibacteriaceae bacterium]|nr:glycosyltransferase family 9 protein [Ignavibacteriaceae bacterium]